ncbi:MAG: sigma-54 interaction domain-containing protein [Panacagrimonas sp.]
MKILASWIGLTDLKAARGEPVGDGPIAQAVATGKYQAVVLLNNLGPKDGGVYEAWIRTRSDADIRVIVRKLTSPTAYREIFLAARSALDEIVEEFGRDVPITLHLSPGTPAMASMWIFLSQMGYRCDLIDSSREQGVRELELPFDMAAEFIPARAAAADASLQSLSWGAALDPSAFEEIGFRSEVMTKVIHRAQVVARRAIPVLIEGESGTGKELLARAIHKASPRAAGPFVAVNCGAIVAELMESEFFGHRKGSFTGATGDRKGHFREANGGTLFLDEIGELPLAMQVKLLRALQESKVVPVGASEPAPVDVRIVAATNRNLVTEASEGRFREDLFYRLAVAVIRLPALRDRQGDVGLLVDRLAESINDGLSTEVGWTRKKLSAGAKKVALQHHWPGNIRELQNALMRAIVWANGPSVTAEEMKAAIIEGPAAARMKVDFLNLPIEKGIDLPELIATVAQTYIPRALDAERGNKTRAAALLGLSSYQTLSNWMEKYDIPG